MFRGLLRKFLFWRVKNVSDKVFIMFLAVLVGIFAGLAAVIIKNSVHLIQAGVKGWFSEQAENYLFFLYPIVGISLTVIVARYLIRQRVGHGIPTVLYAISRDNGRIKTHNTFSSIITSALTVGFGGSVGLEGPTVATGAAIGSNLGRLFHLNYKQIMLLLGCACTGAMAAIFKAPIAAIVFAIEVIMLDLTMASLVPLLISSVTAALTSYLFFGQNFIYFVEKTDIFKIADVPYYILLGIVAGLISVYFTKTYLFIGKKFEKITSCWKKLMIGGGLLGVIIFLFPSLYGEGYEVINACLHGDSSHLYNSTIYFNYQNNTIVFVLAFSMVILFKVVATSLTFGAGGIGGIFAPALFLGANLGLFFQKVTSLIGINISATNFALVGMAGTIAGIIHAPLTAIFLIAELTGGYGLILPLMIVSTISFATVKIFTPNSVYTMQLAKRGELMTHHKDKAMLSMLKLDRLVEKNFLTVKEDYTLGQLVEVIQKSTRNIYPVVDDDNNLKGIVILDHVRHIMFNKDMYDDNYVRNLMFTPSPIVDVSDTMEEVAEKFQQSGNYNMPVTDNGKYVGFISRARIFSNYRRILKHFSED
ncbi:MAG: chloride channel protein [Bacteroidales bacterium]|nr:chloride channel protein [Bacteroidales bacterium]